MNTKTASHDWILRTPKEFVALRLPKRAMIIFVLLTSALVSLFAINLTLGSYSISIGELMSALIYQQGDAQTLLVIWEFRLPRSLAAAIVGAMLALSGAALQQVTRNPLADPSLVGISQGAGFAVVALTVIYPQGLLIGRPWVAIMGSLCVAGLIQWLSASKQGQSSIRFLLAGIGVSAFITAASTVLLTYGDAEEAISALAWLAGSVNATNWSDVSLLAQTLFVLLPMVLILSRLMTVQALGDHTAIGLGAPVRTLRNITIVMAVALAAIATAVTGPIAFVGLIAPHAAKRLCQCGYGLRLLITAVLGANLVVLADIVGRMAFSPIQIPAGLVCAFIGVPFFIALLMRRNSQVSANQ
jgi:iron complex transport system permease protein